MKKAPAEIFSSRNVIKPFIAYAKTYFRVNSIVYTRPEKRITLNFNIAISELAPISKFID